MEGPIELRIKGRVCVKANCGLRHYGLGLCRKHWNYQKRLQLKTELIAALGGRCMRCLTVFHSSAYDFHHRDPEQKDFSFGDLGIDNPEKTRLEVLGKCNLLCANCHRLTHFEENEDVEI